MANISNNTKADSWVRSWTKSFTWRVLGIVILILLSYCITGSWVEASLITFVFHAIRVVLYVLHERAWELTAWGRVQTQAIGCNEKRRGLKELENKSIYIIREAYAEFENPAILWSRGKDSTTALALCRKAFFGKIPFPAIHIDTSYNFRQMYEFRDRIVEEWGFDLVIAKNEEAINEGMGPEKGKLECCTALKTEALMK